MTIVLPEPPVPVIFCSRLCLVHVLRQPADERLVGLDLAARSLSNVPACMARRMRWSMNHAVFCVTPMARWIS